MLTIKQLEEALACAHQALDSVYMTANAERARRAIVALEAEIELLEQAKTARGTCRSCEMWIYTTDEPKTLTPAEALRALADGKCIRVVNYGVKYQVRLGKDGHLEGDE